MSYANIDDIDLAALLQPQFDSGPSFTARPLKQDAFLQTRPMGTNGGYLTSPMTGFKGISVFADPAGQQTLSPAFTLSENSGGLEDITRKFAPNNNKPAALGRGLGFDTLDYNHPSLRIYGLPIDAENIQPGYAAASGKSLGLLPYPEQMPTMTLGRGKKNVRDVGPLDLPTPALAINRSGFTAAPETISASPNMLLSPSSQPKKRNKKQLTVRTEVAPSAPTTPKQIRSVTSPFPTTPVSAHIGAFDLYGGCQVPFNTPAAPGHTPNPNQMPFSFSELMDLGLGVLDLGQEEAMKADYGQTMPMSFESFLAPPLMAFPPQSEIDFSLLTSLPTPGLVNSSVLSSPASSAWSGASPLLSPAAPSITLENYAFPLDSLLMPQSPFVNSPIPSSPCSSAAPYSPMFSPGADFSFLNHDPYAPPGSVETVRASRPLNRKRSRLDFEAAESEAELEGDDGSEYGDGADSDYRPAQFGVPPDMQPGKKLRTVSAPLAGPRLKPGPKPRATSSKAGGPTQSASSGDFDLNQYLTSGDEQSESEENKNSVPKVVIQSMYSLLPGGNKTNSKRYLCLIEGCQRTFPRKSAIESHIQTHLEDKPYICSEADWFVFVPRSSIPLIFIRSRAAFVRQHDLRRHERIHSGTKPFSCPWYAVSHVQSQLD